MSNSRAETIYQYIVAFKSVYDGNSPSIREISRACEIPSTSLVEYYLAQLVDEGKIEMTKELARSKIMVKGGCWRIEQ